ncbi:MAG: UrcA family protein [Steroidobacteraceae bacterium]
MHSNSSTFRTLVSAVLATATSVATYSALAQEKTEITVEATREGPSRSPTTGAPINTVMTKRVVTYADVSLTTPSGVSVLETRIRDAASSACAELDQKYPVTAAGDSTQRCYNAAVESAMVDARRAIDAAKQRGPAYTAPAPGIQVRDEITVEAAREGPSRSTLGAPIETVTAKRVVSYADVSLTTSSGVTVLQTRIRDAANAACTELEQKYPVPAAGETSKKCVDDAVEGAMVDARKAIDAAKAGRAPKVASDSE